MKTIDPLGKALKNYVNGNKSGKIIVKSNISEDEVISVDYFNLEKEKYDTLLFMMNGVGICGHL